jgi:signal transduction histidine kinase
MGELMRSYDWSRSPVGPVDQWPQSLRTAVSILLDSRYPMYIAWGENFVQFYNDAYRPILGATKHPAALGRSTRETFAEIWPFIGPMFEQVMRSGQATYLEDQLLPLERYGYAEECYFTFCYSAIRNETGDVGGVFVTCSENTSRVLGERRLRTLRDLGASVVAAPSGEAAAVEAAAVLDNNPADIPFAVIYVVDDDRVARRVASTGDLGDASVPDVVRLDEPGDHGWLATHELRELGDVAARFGRIPSRLWPEDVQSAVVVSVARSSHEAELDVLLLMGLSPRRPFDDDYRGFASLTARQIGSAVAAARAYEAERRRAQALAELDRAKTTFFSNVSHELRTPLTLMLGPIEDLLAVPREADGDREKLELLHRNGLRLLKLVNTLLDFARIEAGRVQASFEPVDLARLTADLASTFRSAVERAGMHLDVQCAAIGEPVYVDVGMWEKIALNLLSNAFKFTLEGGIRVSVSRVDDRVRVAVGDTGAGIAAEELPHIFERFRRVEGARSRSAEGSGIGLALVQELVRLHGGGIRVESEVGIGTTVTIELPLGSKHLPKEHILAAASEPQTVVGASPFVEEALRWLPDEQLAEPRGDAGLIDGARVLVVDDNADMREYLGKLLGASYVVDVASDGIDALAKIRRNPPALVLTDIMMPRMDGFALIEAMRADPRTAAIPVIALSARAGEERTVEGLAHGADDYLVKPFSARELMARVRAHLQFTRALRLERDRLVRLFEQSPSFIAVLKGPEHVFEVANGAYLALVGNRDIVGKTLLEALPELAGQGYKELLDDVYATGVPYRGNEARVDLARERGGPPQEAYVDFVYHPIVEPDGRISGVFVHGVDITKQVLARNEMEALYQTVKEANDAKRQFLAAMSHELRTPLNAVIGYTDLLLLGVRGAITPAQHDDVERIRRASQYLLTLITDILNFSRVEAGQVDLRPQTVSVHEVLERARSLVQAHLETRGLALRLAQVDESLSAIADPERLQQILLNLLMNASKFTSSGGHITLRADADERYVFLRVEDTGSGIPSAQLEQIFEPFVQLRRSTDPESRKGLGLGLAISRELARRMSGDVTATSEEGVGSCFTVVLPRALPRALP